MGGRRGAGGGWRPAGTSPIDGIAGLRLPACGSVSVAPSPVNAGEIAMVRPRGGGAQPQKA
jgi:hypothetical protein